MSIQRFEGATAPRDSGRYVLYTDHVAAMEAEAESAHDLGVIYGINHERARIRQGILNGLTFCNYHDENDYCVEAIDISEALSIIDGEGS